LALVQGKLDLSVPQSDYLSLQNELDLLREEHLLTLRREVEMRTMALKGTEQVSTMNIRISTFSYLYP